MTAADVDVVYRGHGNENPGGGRLVTVETLDGHLLGTLRHVVKHSATGYTWGYGGSGPADLARSLLVAALGSEEAKCSTCGGTRRVTYDVELDDEVRYDPEVHRDVDADDVYVCFQCDEGIRRLPYQLFKFEVVARLPSSWTMTRSEIRAWLAANGVQR